MQWGLLQDAPGSGLKKLRHEAPRRFRIAGKNLRPGTKLLLLTSTDSKSPPPNLNLTTLSGLFLRLYPTGKRMKDGRPIYETAVELGAKGVYALMLGGSAAPGVLAAQEGRLAEPPKKGSFDPHRWNKHWVWVFQEDGKISSGGWQRIRIK